MEIPEEIQRKLKCSECDELLSCGPVYLLHETGGAICGRCSQQPEENNSTENSDRTRNEPYEATASLLAFPCAFAAHGCREKVVFTLGQPPHESNCKFRPFICPVASRGTCEWIGSWPTLMKHCSEKHPSNLLPNPCKPPRPDLTASSLQTYIISAFRFLFLLHVKVCVTSGKLFHSIRMLGDTNFLDKFSFTLEIEANDIKVTKLGSVLPSGIMMVQEPTAICTTINSLLGILGGGFNQSKFSINIQTLNCLNCFKNIDKGTSSIFCVECEGKLVKCKFSRESCIFEDVNKDKLWKHENMFCEHQTKCYYCDKNFVSGSFIEHMISLCGSEETFKSNINSVVRITCNYDTYYSNILFFSNNIGTVICKYDLTVANLEVLLYTSLPSYELKNFKCSVELTDPLTKHTLLLKPETKFNKQYDWYINKKLDNFPSWEKVGIDLKINIDENVI